MSDLERMSPDLILPNSNNVHHSINLEEEPRDLTIKRKLRPVPPPLDLSKRTLELDQLTGLINSPKSPFAQKNLPLRKRAYSWSSQPESLGLQVPSNSHLSVIQGNCEVKHRSSNLQANLPCSSSSSLKYELHTPHTPHTPHHHPHSAIPVITSCFNFGENSGTNPNTLGVPVNQGPLNLSTTSVGTLPSSLLSPAPSHPSSSSLNSSREELEPDNMIPEYQMIASPRNGRLKHTMMDISTDMHSPNNISPSHHWPTTVWSVFLSGVQIHFILGAGQITGGSFSEDLGTLERNHHKHYAPQGLQLLKIVLDPTNGPYSSPSLCQLYFRPVGGVGQEDIMVITPTDHPFYVKGKGWSSIFADQASDRYNIPCHQLLEGDVCLPPYYQELTDTAIPVVTPDLTDAMKRFDFNDDNCDGQNHNSCSAPPSATFPPQTHRSVFLSPPASPSKKTIRPVISVPPQNETVPPNGPKSRRPMNGFMLFAKHHRLKLIQQYPGKDNRAISVLLGAMWKALPDEERERFNCEARLQAEERKRIDPDCWKRKRSHSTS